MSYRAFVSSTFLDLREHRQYAIAALRRAGFSVDPMEDWPSSAREPTEVSVDRIAGCDLCILLIARRRGHVPEGKTLSITQMEVEEVIQRGIDVLAFELDDTENDWPAFEEESAVRDWRKSIQERFTPGHFRKKPESLDIASALFRWREERRAEEGIGRYVALVEREHGTVRFLGLPHLRDIPNVPMERLFVEPAISSEWHSPDSLPANWRATAPSLERLLDDHSGTVLLGDPGCGKSTVVSWLAWQTAEAYRSRSPRERRQHLVPLPFVLRDLSIGRNVTWQSLLLSFMSTPQGQLLEPSYLDLILKKGRGAILLDGLDEVGGRLARRALRTAIWDGIVAFPKCRWLLTSRVVGYGEVPFDTRPRRTGYRQWFTLRSGRPDPSPSDPLESTALEHLRVSYVVPFDDPRVNAFARNWFELREESPPRRHSMTHEFLAAVRSNESTTRLGRIPNLLLMMALIYRNDAQLPHGRALLYSKIVEAYLETIDNWRRIQRSSEEWVARRRWLARVGLEMQVRRAHKSKEADREILADGPTVRNWITLAMRSEHVEDASNSAAEFVDYLGRRSGLLLPRADDRFAFLHLSFQEFFAAVFLREEIVSPAWISERSEVHSAARRSSLRDAADLPAWRETLVFLVELVASDLPQWLRPLRDTLFGADLELVAPRSSFADPLAWLKPTSRDSTGECRALLLATLAVDPHSGSDAAFRTAATNACCDWVMSRRGRQIDSKEGDVIVRTLTSGDSSAGGRVMTALIDSARKYRVMSLNLSHTDISDVTPLQNCADVRELDLSWTRVVDPTPLAGLRNLRRLDLRGTQVPALDAEMLRDRLGRRCVIEH